MNFWTWLVVIWLLCNFWTFVSVMYEFLQLLCMVAIRQGLLITVMWLLCG
jgi:hypothetical protein